MPTRTDGPIGSPCWVDLATTDTAAATSFYGAVFGWTAEAPDPQFGGYFNFLKNGVPVAGCMTAMPDGAANVWSVYLTTDDAEKTVDAAVANGGQAIVPAMQVGDLGTMAVVIDAQGAVVGAWQPGTHRGFGLMAETGAPSWFELHARDYAAAVTFYRDVFRWETNVMSDTEEFRYTTLSVGDEMYAGLMDAAAFLPEVAPPSWSTYFGVDDADASLAQIVELGGSVVEPAEDTPYGRLAAAADPLGARFKIVAPNAHMPAKP